MATTWYGAESGTAGTSVVVVDNTARQPASDVGTAAKAYTGSTMQFVTDAMHGARAIKISGSSGGSSYVQLTPTSGWSSRTIAETFYFKFDTAATQDVTHVYASASGARIFALTRNAANKWRLQGPGSLTNVWTSVNAVPLNAWIRVELYVKIDATTGTAGTFNLAIYDADTDTLLETEQNITGVDWGTTAPAGLFVGKFDSGTYAGGITFDSYGYNDTATSRLGKFPQAAATVSVGSAQNVAPGATVNLSGTSSNGSYSWAFAVASPSAPTLTGANTASPSFVAGPAGSVYALTLTNGAGQSGTVEVRVPLAATGTEMRPIAAAPAGTWTGVGGTTGLAVLGDESDATWFESPTLTTTEAEMRNRYQPSENRGDGTFTLRCDKYAPGGGTPGTATIKVRLYLGSGSTNIVQEWTITPTTAITDWPCVLSQASLDAIAATTDGWKQVRYAVVATS